MCAVFFYMFQVFVNGINAGSHTGGYDSFSFDISALLKEALAEQELIVVVEDPTESQAIPVGKQWAGGERPFGFIFYTPSSGIWQTVWLEGVPEEHITKISVKLQLERELVEVTVKQKGSEDVTVSLFEGENGPQVSAINMLRQSSCQNMESWRQQFFLVRLGR